MDQIGSVQRVGDEFYSCPVAGASCARCYIIERKGDMS
jgi:hypothetical protein